MPLPMGGALWQVSAGQSENVTRRVSGSLGVARTAKAIGVLARCEALPAMSDSGDQVRPTSVERRDAMCSESQSSLHTPGRASAKATSAPLARGA